MPHTLPTYPFKFVTFAHDCIVLENPSRFHKMLSSCRRLLICCIMSGLDIAQHASSKDCAAQANSWLRVLLLHVVALNDVHRALRGTPPSADGKWPLGSRLAGLRSAPLR